MRTQEGIQRPGWPAGSIPTDLENAVGKGFPSSENKLGSVACAVPSTTWVNCG